MICLKSKFYNFSCFHLENKNMVVKLKKTPSIKSLSLGSETYVYLLLIALFCIGFSQEKSGRVK